MTDSSTNDASTSQELLQARLLLVAASLMWSIGGVCMKSPLLAGLSGTVLAFYRAIFAGAFLICFVKRAEMRWRWGLVPAVVIFTIMNVTYITSVTMTSAAAAIFLQYTSTVWAALMSVYFLKEPFERTTLIPLAGAVAGITMIVFVNHAPGQASGNWLGLISGVFYAGVVVSLRALRTENAAWLTALNHLGASVASLPLMLAADQPLNWQQVAFLGGVGILQMGLPYVMFARAMRHVKTTEAALIPVLEPILNPIWVWLAWGEQVNGSVLAGGGLILSTLLVKYWLDARLRPPLERKTPV